MKIIFCNHLIWLIKGEGHLERANALRKNPAPFAVSLKSRKHKDTVANSQLQKRLDSLLKNHGKLGESQQEGGFVGAILAATVRSLLWLP